MFFADNTEIIRTIEDCPIALFARPFRFGKSLLISMLEAYYDIQQKDNFDVLFGGLNIHQQPTKLQNTYYVLRFNLAPFDLETSSPQRIHDLINRAISDFIGKYRFTEIEVNHDNAIDSLQAVFGFMRNQNLPLYIMIDEYDKATNALLLNNSTQYLEFLSEEKKSKRTNEDKR